MTCDHLSILLMMMISRKETLVICACTGYPSLLHRSSQYGTLLLGPSRCRNFCAELGLEGDGARTEALAERHFRWEEGGRQVGGDNKVDERERPEYSVRELVEKLKKTLQGSYNTSAPVLNEISYRFIKALLDTVFKFVQMAKELKKECASEVWQLSKGVIVPKPGKDHVQLKGW